MKVFELIAELLKYPDDMDVAIPDDLYKDLDYGLVIDAAIDFYPTRPDGRGSWCWVNNSVGKGFDGKEVVVIF